MSDLEQSDGQNLDIELPLAVKLEALLFVAAEPATTAQLATALDVAPSVIERGLNELDASLSTRGLRLQRHGGRVQLTTAPELAELVERFLGLESTSPGRPGPSARSDSRIKPLLNKLFIILSLFTPRIASICGRVTGCW